MSTATKIMEMKVDSIFAIRDNLSFQRFNSFIPKLIEAICWSSLSLRYSNQKKT